MAKQIHLALLLAGLSLGSTALAQTEPPVVASDTKVAQGKQRFDLKIDNIALPDLVDYLAEVTGENLVLMVPPGLEAGQVRIPPLKLKHVSLEQVLELVTTMPGVEMNYDISGEDAGLRLIALRLRKIDNQPPLGAFAPIGVPANQLLPEGGVQPFAAGMSGEPFLSVLPLERILLGQSPAERVPDDAKRNEILEARTRQALTLIDQAFTMDPHGQAKPDIKLHPETRTLLVKATQAQLSVVNQVLTALEVPGQSDARKDFERQLQDMMRQSRMQQDQLKNELEHKLRMMEEQVVRMQREREALEVRARELQAELQKAQTALPRPQDKPDQPQ